MLRIMIALRAVGVLSALQLLAYCAAPANTRAALPAATLPPAPLQERIPPSEAHAIEQIRRLLIAQVSEQYAGTKGTALRDAHPKAHGCVKGRFTVAAGVPPSLRAGLFAQPRSYITWIRFSNAVGTDDHHGLARGMAIKLTGVPGRKLLPDEASALTQDFLVVNYPVFNVRTDDDYLDFLTKSANGQLPIFFRAHPDTARLTQAVAAVRVANPLYQRYFSMTPYTLGSRYVKYSAEPISCRTGSVLHDAVGRTLPRDRNYLRTAMAATLAHGPSCFRFMVQPQVDARTMPVEDATVLWDERRSPFQTVATITIPRQRFNSPAQMRFCENLSYTPWHALPAHRPAGNINRIRRVVYDAISSLRHRLNGIVRREPTGRESFEGNKHR